MKIYSSSKHSSPRTLRFLAALTCGALVLAVTPLANATRIPAPRALQDQTAAAKIPPEQLESLVAPIALYPDNLLSQTLVASTYPLEIMQLQQWLDKNQSIAKDQAKLAEAMKKQPWDPSIQAMAVLPDVVKRLADDVQWTTDLGNAFLAQQSDVMDAIQRMRTKAQGTGALASNQQQKVETQTVESKQVIVIEQSNPQTVYVPSYNPTVVYGAPAYPYPPIYYPPSTGAVIAASAISFGVGMAMGAAWGGGWGWGCGWGGGDVNVNMNNNFNRNTNVNNISGNRVNSGNRSGGGKWQHNPSHRGGAPYGDRGTANRFGGTTRGDSLANRQQGARNQVGRQGGNLGSTTRPGGVGDRGGVGNRGGVGDNRGGVGDNRGGVGNNRGGVGDNRGGVGDNRGGVGNNRGGVTDNRGGAGNNRGGVGDNRGGAGNQSGLGGNRGSSGVGSAGGDRVGNRSVGGGSSPSSGNRGGGGFGGSSGGFNGGAARQSSSRGASSMSSGASRGGGGFGGGGGASRGGGGASRGGGGGGGRRR